MKSFTAIDNEITKSAIWKELSLSAKVIYFRLRMFSDIQNKAVWPSLEKLANLEGMTRKTVSKAIHELIDYNIIKTSHKGRKFLFHFAYGVNITPLKETNMYKLPDQCVKFTHRNGENLHTNNIKYQYIKEVDLVPFEKASFSINSKIPEKNNINNGLKAEKKKELEKLRQKLIDRLEKDGVFLGQLAIEKINILGKNDMYAHWYQYERDLKKDKIDNKDAYWNKNLEADDYDLGYGHAVARSEDAGRKNIQTTLDLIERYKNPPVVTNRSIKQEFEAAMTLDKAENVRIEMERRKNLSKEDKDMINKIKEIRGRNE